MSSIANDILMVIFAGLVGGLVANCFRQPLIIGYLIAGIFIGPFTPGFTVTSPDTIGMLADIGVALLLFTLGLEFPLKTLQSIRKIAFWGTPIQLVFTLVLSSAIWYMMSHTALPSLWFGTALLSSSTAVILKTLTTSKLEKSLSGRIMLGMSIIQDLAIIPVMIVLINWHNSGNIWLAPWKPIFLSIVFVLIMWFVGSKLCRYLFSRVARLESRELFLMLTLVFGLGIGYLTQAIGLSYAFGAFVAGMVISESEYSHKAISDLIPLRDIFGLVFFVSVGMLLNIEFLKANWGFVLAVMLLMTITRGSLLAIISYCFGYRRIIPIALLCGMLPISEMAFVLIRMGKQSGVVDDYLYNFILTATILSMLIGPFAAGLTSPLYRLYLRLFARTSPVELANLDCKEKDYSPVVIAGNSYVEVLGAVLTAHELHAVIITPVYQVFRKFSKAGTPVIYGVPDQSNVLTVAGIEKARLLIVAAGNYSDTKRIVKSARNLNPELKCILQADNAAEARLMNSLDAVEIVIPQREAEVEMLQQALSHLMTDQEQIQRITYFVRGLDTSETITPEHILEMTRE